MIAGNVSYSASLAWWKIVTSSTKMPLKLSIMVRYFGQHDILSICCWFTVYDIGPELKQLRVNVSCWQGWCFVLFLRLEINVNWASPVYPCRREMVSQCWVNAGPASATLAKHQPNIGWCFLTCGRPHIISWRESCWHSLLWRRFMSLWSGQTL